MMPAQGSAISGTTHFTGGQVDPFISFDDQRHMQADAPLLDLALDYHRQDRSFKAHVLPWARLSVAGQACSLKPFPPANLQVLLPSGRVPNLGCPEHLGDMDMMQQVTPPPKRPPLPRLDIPGASSGAYVPTSAAHNVSSFTLPPHHHHH